MRTKRSKTPSFILELPLKVSRKQEKELLSRLESARQLYNAILGEAKKRVNLVRQSKINQQARKIPRDTQNEAKRKQRKELFQKANDLYNFNEYSLHSYACKLRHNLDNNLDVHTTQKLAKRAFQSASKILYGIAKNVRFKSYNQFDSVESKSNAAGIRWRNNKVEWNGLLLEPIIKIDDEVIEYGLKHRVKYSRIYRKEIKGVNRFYVQLILEGKPYIKEKNKLGQGKVCFDVGPSTLATVSMKKQNDNYEFNARLEQFCSELNTRWEEIKKLQRHIERQRRQNNPKNYLENGKIKSGKLIWKKSKRQVIEQKKLKELYRMISAHRKSLHGKLSNEIIRMGNDFSTENVNVKWLQKKYGRSVGIRAPGMFISLMNRKAESAGGSFNKFETFTTKLSQSCICGKQTKKDLSVRVHDCKCGVYCQRDLFSAFLGLFVEKIGMKDVLQIDQARRAWPSADNLLRMVWRTSIESMSGKEIPSSFGTKFQSQNRSSAKGSITKTEVRDVVGNTNNGITEISKEVEVFLPEPTGF